MFANAKFQTSMVLGGVLGFIATWIVIHSYQLTNFLEPPSLIVTLFALPGGILMGVYLGFEFHQKKPSYFKIIMYGICASFINSILAYTLNLYAEDSSDFLMVLSLGTFFGIGTGLFYGTPVWILVGFILSWVNHRKSSS